MTTTASGSHAPSDSFDDDSVSLKEIVGVWRSHASLLVIAPIVVTILAAGLTFLLTPRFTATTLFVLPQQSQNAVGSALASLGALSSLAGGMGAVRTPADQYVSLMQSASVSNRIIDEYKLMTVYESKLKVDARKKLAEHVRFNVGKKDGLVSIDVEDESPQRASDIANRYVDELRRLTASLALTEAQQRRIFFEEQLRQTREKLVSAQQALQSSGFTQGALKAEPKAAAEVYARTMALAAAAEVRLQSMRSSLSDDTPEVRQQVAVLSGLRAELSKAETVGQSSTGPDYISKFRDFKYQETLFELYARQFELARVDESREGVLIQVIDPATPPERKSYPKRLSTALAAGMFCLVALALGLVVRRARQVPRANEPAVLR
jgi:uncharacterized protein involved in exopolysaccharide biosynthesis